MASKYSNYELKPYVSTYANPYSVEVNEVLRKRYDDNKASVDLIDKTLGSKQVLDGDRVHVEKAKGMVEEKFTKITNAGDYENATLVVDEVMVDLETNKGLQYAQQSYVNRQNELKYIQEANMQGFEMLDFGQFSVSGHQSYTQDEESGAWEKNIYQPASEKQHAYDESIRGLIGNIRADSSGISQGKADRIAKNLLPGYLDSFVGDQHFRKLTQLEGMSEGEATATILKQIESFTDQQVHYVASKAIKESAGNPYYQGYNPDLSTLGNPLGLETESELSDHDLTMLSQVWDVYNHNTENSTTEEINSKNRLMNERSFIVNNEIKNAEKTNKITKVEADGYKKNMIDPFRGNGVLQFFIQEQTQPKSATEQLTEWNGAGPIDHSQALINASITTGGSWLASSIYKSVKEGKVKFNGMKGKTVAKLALVSFAISEAVQYVDKVTDPSNNTGGSIFRNLNTKGTFGADSRIEVFESNMRKTQVLYNKGIMDTRPGSWQGEKGNLKFVYDVKNGVPCNCPFKNGDPFWEQQIKNGKNSMLYMSEGGGSAIFETIEDLGPVEHDVDVYIPSNTPDGIKQHKLNNAYLDNMHITDFDWRGFSEESDSYKKYFMTDVEKQLYKDMKFMGIMPGGVDEGHGSQVVMTVGTSGKGYGNKSFASPKGSKGMSFIESAFMNQGRPDAAAEASSYDLLMRMEYSNSGNNAYSQSGGITRWDELDVLSKNLYRITQEHTSNEDKQTMAPITMEGAIDAAHKIIQNKLYMNNQEVFKAIDQYFPDPTMNAEKKQAVFTYLYGQEFLRNDSDVDLKTILNIK